MNELNQEQDVLVKGMIAAAFKTTKDISIIEKVVNNRLEKENFRLAKGSIKSYVDTLSANSNNKLESALQDEKEIRSMVDTLLKSVGQSLDENENQKEEKKKSLFDKNSPENHLRFCEVCVDKEAEREANYG